MPAILIGVSDGARRGHVPGADHFPMLSAPDDFERIVRGVLG